LKHHHDISKTHHFSNGAVYADLDNDGDLDIVVNNINDLHWFMRTTAFQKNQLLHLLRSI